MCMVLDIKKKECALSPKMVLNLDTHRIRVREELKYHMEAGAAWQFDADVPLKFGLIAEAESEATKTGSTSSGSTSSGSSSSGSSSDTSTSTLPPRAVIFTLHGASPNITRVEIQLLKSYNDSMGTLTCCLDHRHPAPSFSSASWGCSTSAPTYSFDTKWQDLSSQTDVESMELVGTAAGGAAGGAAAAAAAAGTSVTTKSKRSMNKKPMYDPVFVLCTADSGKVKLIGITSC